MPRGGAHVYFWHWRAFPPLALLGLAPYQLLAWRCSEPFEPLREPEKAWIRQPRSSFSVYLSSRGGPPGTCLSPEENEGGLLTANSWNSYTGSGNIRTYYKKLMSTFPDLVYIRDFGGSSPGVGKRSGKTSKESIASDTTASKRRPDARLSRPAVRD